MPQKRTAAAPRTRSGTAPSLDPTIVPSAASAPVATPRSARAAATRLELLLAAERLFALHGLMGVSLRQIVAATRQRNLATVHYHFGSREALAHAICDLRMPAIEQARAQRLSAYLEDPPPPARRAVELLRIQIEPSAEPVFAARGRSHFRRLLAHSFVSDEIDLRRYIGTHYDRGIRQTGRLLRTESAHLSAATFAVRWALLIRSMTYLLASLEARVEALSWRKGEALLRAEMAEMAVAFAGFFAAPDEAHASTA